MRFLRFISAGLLFTMYLTVASSAQQKPLSPEQAKVVETVKGIFVAAKADDAAKFDQLVLPGFYMYDVGKRFDGDAIIGLIREYHAKGMKFEWNVTEPDVHITGNTAWIAYVNRGRITDPQGKATEQSWLESAFLEKRGGAWKIAFFHSTRVPAEQEAH
ncbi:YybH family protein [Occallatibacter savannae]|uniref:YybH family protein n=1 Tax=Occallatibacter savannae TaxID=1002691 RepID=UPI0013A5A622|nr:nuclear transport factor 2 family protein [Occallatibacter savannae]